MPLRIATSGTEWKIVTPREQWQTVSVSFGRREGFRVDENYYVTVEKVGGAAAAAGSASPRSER